MTKMSQNSPRTDSASDKKVWAAPTLRELDVRETQVGTNSPGSNDGQVDCS